MYKVLKLRHSTDLWNLIKEILTRVFKEKIPGQNKNIENIISEPQTNRSGKKTNKGKRQGQFNPDQLIINDILTKDLGLV